MFTLKKQASQIAHLNVREEKHGEDPILALDIKIQADVANKFLDQLAPGLLVALYQKEGEKPGETADIEAEHLAVLRYPQLGALPWAGEMIAAKIVIHGAKKEENLELDGDVNQLRLVPKEGGTVEITYRVQILPTPEVSGRLAGLLGKKAKVSVTPVLQPELPHGSEE